ncbi:hypothetical protein [Streptomyces goshikiensis]|uniref:hypothetical protein n=1 Tax=Streptomyces goshikiensis TaxID=1942 RepID=UPI00365A0947
MGTVQLGDGPQTLTYHFTSPTAQSYLMTLAVTGASGTYGTRGFKEIQVSQSIGRLTLTIPRWQQESGLDYVEVMTRDTQCDPTNATPPQVSSFTFTLPEGPNIVMVRG